MRKAIGVVVLLALAAIGPITLPLPVHAATLSLTVSGNQLLDGSGVPIELRGVNRSGTEYGCVQGYGPFDGPSDAASVQAIASWHVNIVRVLLNEDCWLGINGAPNGGYTTATYQQDIVNYVNLLHQYGMYAEVSLIWAAPGSNLATDQPGSPDADHSPAMWSSMAATFKSDPAVILAPWGETIVDANCFLNGGVCEATYGPSNTPYNTAGMQQAVTVMRNAGYNGPISIPCITYANDCTQWLSHEPSDPVHQLIAEAHVYGKNTCDNPSCFDQQMWPVAQVVPLIWGEAGETYDASDCGSSVVSVNIPWAMTYTAGVIAWTWDTWGFCDALIGSYSGTPYSGGYGQWVQSYYGQLVRTPSCGSASTATSTAGSGTTTFYFAEGYTGTGFTECLVIFMPNASGQATIDYWTQSAHLLGTVNVTAGKTAVVNVNRAVGPDQQVSVRVTLPASGVVERLMHFNGNGWHGSTDIVGVSAPSTEWDFAEGSTLSYFSEFLSLQNPNSTPVVASLAYMTDSGAHPVKTVTLNAASRTTIEVARGDSVSNVANCVPNGPSASCGVGGGIVGVAVRVTTPSGEPIVAERPFYVNNYGWNFAPINDGHVAFGANRPATHWYFAEGNTIASGSQGFNEYLTLQNPGASSAQVALRYVDQSGNVTLRSLSVSPHSRFTALVFDPVYGVGRGVTGVSAEVTSDQPIVAERPMYMSWNFGAGLVNGATDVVGATTTNTLFGFAGLSTLPGQNDYLTLQNPGAGGANVTIQYFTASGVISRTAAVNPHTRMTVLVFDPAAGLGVGQDGIGVVLTVTNSVGLVVEKPTYGAVGTAYGATDSMAESPATF